jgi:energy-coupling factor transporter ATP-binding protein EcfA2
VPGALEHHSGGLGSPEKAVAAAAEGGGGGGDRVSGFRSPQKYSSSAAAAAGGGGGRFNEESMQTPKMLQYGTSRSNVSRSVAPAVTGGSLLQLQGVTLYTPSGVLACAGLTLNLPLGCNLLVTGPNGCGKSTLVRCLAELWPAAAGTVHIAGRSWEEGGAWEGQGFSGAWAVGFRGLGGVQGGVMFLPQRPLAAPGRSMREQLVYPAVAGAAGGEGGGRGGLGALLHPGHHEHQLQDQQQWVLHEQHLQSQQQQWQGSWRAATTTVITNSSSSSSSNSSSKRPLLPQSSQGHGGSSSRRRSVGWYWGHHQEQQQGMCRRWWTSFLECQNDTSCTFAKSCNATAAPSPAAAAVAAQSDDQFLHHLLDLVGLGHLLSQQGFTLDTPACEPWQDILSPGELQRLAVARVLLHLPAVAVLDEATSCLDSGGEREMYRLLEEAGVVCVSVGHREGLRRLHGMELRLLGDGRGGWEVAELVEG